MTEGSTAPRCGQGRFACGWTTSSKLPPAAVSCIHVTTATATIALGDSQCIARPYHASGPGVRWRLIQRGASRRTPGRIAHRGRRRL